MFGSVAQTCACPRPPRVPVPTSVATAATISTAANKKPKTSVVVSSGSVSFRLPVVMSCPPSASAPAARPRDRAYRETILSNNDKHVNRHARRWHLLGAGPSSWNTELPAEPGHDGEPPGDGGFTVTWPGLVWPGRAAATCSCSAPRCTAAGPTRCFVSCLRSPSVPARSLSGTDAEEWWTSTQVVDAAATAGGGNGIRVAVGDTGIHVQGD